MLHVNLNIPQENLGELLCIIIYKILLSLACALVMWMTVWFSICAALYIWLSLSHSVYCTCSIYICSRSQFHILCTVHIKIKCVSGDLQHLGWHWPTLNVTESEVYKLLGVHFLWSTLRNGTHTCGNPGPCTLPVKQRHTFFTPFLQYIYIIGKQVLGNMNMNFQNFPIEVLFLNFLFFKEHWNSSHISDYTVLLTQNIL